MSYDSESESLVLLDGRAARHIECLKCGKIGLSKNGECLNLECGTMHELTV